MQRIWRIGMCWLFLIFVSGLSLGNDQDLSGKAPQRAEEKNHSGNALKEETNQAVREKTEVRKEQAKIPSVSEGKGASQQTTEGESGASPAMPNSSEGSKDLSSKPEGGGGGSRETQASDSEKAKGEEKALEEKAPLEKQPLDRRWFMKNTAEQGKKAFQKKPAPIKWKDETQKTRCQGYREDLRTKYSKTQNYSVQGDACRTAENAESFLNLFEIFTGECPNEFVLQSGYSPTVKENVMRLKELGTKECLRGGGGRPR